MNIKKLIGVYSITNRVSGRVYIGSTTIGFGNRWAKHVNELTLGRHKNRHLQNAWYKYGADSFDFEVVEFIDDPDQVLTREQFWITHFMGQGISYNLSPSAGSNRGMRLSDATKRQIGAANRGKKRTPEQLARQSQIMKARPPNLKFQAAGRVSSVKTYHSLVVSPDGVIYATIRNLQAFCREHGLHAPAMLWVVTGKHRSHRGWRRLDAPIPVKREKPDPNRVRIQDPLRDPEVRERARLTRIRKTYDFIAPDGTPHHVTDLLTFCKEHDLEITCMRGVANEKQKLKAHRGWSVPGWARRACAFIAPDGARYEGITNLAAFCEERGLSAAHMSSVFTGKRPHHHGWKRAT